MKICEFYRCNLRKYRNLANLSQQYLATQVGISRNHLSNIERGKCIPSVVLAIQLVIELNFWFDCDIALQEVFVWGCDLYAKPELIYTTRFYPKQGFSISVGEPICEGDFV